MVTLATNGGDVDLEPAETSVSMAPLPSHNQIRWEQTACTQAYQQKQFRSELPKYTISQNAMGDTLRLETKYSRHEGIMAQQIGGWKYDLDVPCQQLTQTCVDKCSGKEYMFSTA